MAPEFISDDESTLAANLSNFWSLGVLIFEMCYGRNPFYSRATQKICKNITSGKFGIPNYNLSTEGRNIINGLLNRNPKHRLGSKNGVEELKAHPFFADIDWARLRKRDVIPPFKPAIAEEQESGPLKFGHELASQGNTYGSPSSYQTAPSRFGSLSTYGTPSSYSDFWSRGSGPSGDSLLKQILRTKEQGDHRLQKPYSDIVADRGLLLPQSKELDWSGRGQHVEFGIKEDVPLKPLAAIGYGGSALVDSVLCRRIKLARKLMTCSRKQNLDTMINEVEHLQRLSHPHIVQLVGSYLQGKKFEILLYPVAQWNLSTFLERCQEINAESWIIPEILPQCFRCLSHTLAYIHANTMKHMDIKPQNVLIRESRKEKNRFNVYL
jgi:serine/threonine protein kinase